MELNALKQRMAYHQGRFSGLNFAMVELSQDGIKCRALDEIVEMSNREAMVIEDVHKAIDDLQQGGPDESERHKNHPRNY